MKDLSIESMKEILRSNEVIESIVERVMVYLPSVIVGMYDELKSPVLV